MANSDKSHILEKIENLNKFISWVESFGSKLNSNSRVCRYRDLYENIYEDEKRLQEFETVRLVFNASMECTELLKIFDSLKNLVLGDKYKRKIVEVTKGPEVYVWEKGKSSSNHPRNIQFELAVISKFVDAGALIIESDIDADALISISSKNIVVECKRPQHFSRSNYKSHLKKAKRKLNDCLKLFDEDYYGLIALDVTKIINPKLAVFEGTWDDQKLMLRDALRKLGDDTFKEYSKYGSEKIIGYIAKGTTVYRAIDCNGRISVYDQWYSESISTTKLGKDIANEIWRHFVPPGIVGT